MPTVPGTRTFNLSHHPAWEARTSRVMATKTARPMPAPSTATLKTLGFRGPDVAYHRVQSRALILSNGLIRPWLCKNSSLRLGEEESAAQSMQGADRGLFNRCIYNSGSYFCSAIPPTGFRTA
jgi:hypothetical protein